MSAADTLEELHHLAAASRARGDALFPALAQCIAKTLNASESLIARAVDATHVRTLALYAHGAPAPNYEYDVGDTPCAAVLKGETVHHESGLAERFPRTSQGKQGYFGVPLTGADGSIIGHFCVYNAGALPVSERQRLWCEVFAG